MSNAPVPLNEAEALAASAATGEVSRGGGLAGEQVFQQRLARVAVVIFLVAAGGLALASTGTPEDDAIAHFLMNRSAWDEPALLLHPWGRPGHTVPYALAAWMPDITLALRFSNLLSVLFTAAAGLMTAAVARRVGVRHWGWAAVLLLVMPLVIKTGTTVLTETVAAFYVAAGTLLLLNRRPMAAALVFGLLPLTRHESVVLLPALAVYFAWRRSWAAVLLLAVPEVGWNLAAKVWLWPDRWMLDRFLSPPSSDGLGRGHPLHYLGMWVQAATPAGVALTAAGALPLTRKLYRTLRVGRARVASEQAAGLALCVGGGLGMVLLQTYLYAFNTHASGGYARFLLPAMPWMAVCSAAALQPLAILLRRRRSHGLTPTRLAAMRWRVRVLVALLVAVAVGGSLGLAISFDVRLMISRYTTWELAAMAGMWLATLAAAVAGGFIWQNPGSRRALASFVAAGGVCLIVGAAWHATPVGLDTRARLGQHAVLAVQTAGVEPEQIDGSTPWVDYFLDRPISPHGTFPENTWPTAAATGRVWLHDLRYAQGRLSREEALQVPAEVVYTGPADDSEGAIDAEAETTPYMVGLRRK